ncbi:MAG: DAK2 domain-containing protein [Clostridia bacterium]|nr:DAK2 domain-containing protein [Clostridia bacterium]
MSNSDKNLKKTKNNSTEAKKQKKNKATEDNAKKNTKKTEAKAVKQNKKSAAKKTGEKKPAKTTAPTEQKKKMSLKTLGGALFAKMMKGGASELRANAEEVNKLNVFPVPDGDTGDNMSMTIDSGVASLNDIETDDLAEVLRVASRGMLLGARGNSGVILSQFFAGMAKGLENVETANSKELGHALELGVEQAYGSVMTPTEGTILTVARESVEYAVSRLNSRSTVQSLFSDLVNEMNKSLERTPELLPALSEAGVVDSGGAGLLYIIDGLNRVLNGEDVEYDAVPLPVPKAGALQHGAFGPDSEMTYGYCTELLVQLQNRKCDVENYDMDALKLYLSKLGDSIVAFKTESVVKIHVHTLTPERVLARMRKVGEFISVKIENMSIQHTETDFAGDKSEQKKNEPKKKNGIVAVSNGPGISAIFSELGTDVIVPGGQTNNPSTNDFIEAFEQINADNIFVFPNNGNIVMAASQAAEIYDKAKVYVIPAKTIGTGYVALSSMNFDSSSPDELVKEAEEAISRVVSAYISPAVRDADMNGVHINDGDTIAIINKEIVVSEPERDACAKALIDKLLESGERFLLTVFIGADATAKEAAALEVYVTSKYPDTEVYFIDGGQEIYPYLFVAE